MHKKTTPLAERKEKILKSFKKIDEKFVYKIVESITADKKLLQEEVPVLQQAGMTVVLLVNGQQMTHLAPGQDPYQARQRINSFFKAQEQAAQIKKKAEASSTSKTTAKKTKARTSPGIRVEKISI